VLIGRGAEFTVPNGGTILRSGDRLLVLADRDDLRKTRMAVGL
jgi:Trk K+ transport system NAD-binding subunit